MEIDGLAQHSLQTLSTMPSCTIEAGKIKTFPWFFWRCAWARSRLKPELYGERDICFAGADVADRSHGSRAYVGASFLNSRFWPRWWISEQIVEAVTSWSQTHSYGNKTLEPTSQPGGLLISLTSWLCWSHSSFPRRVRFVLLVAVPGGPGEFWSSNPSNSFISTPVLNLLHHKIA